MSWHPRRTGVVLPAIHRGNGDVTAPRDLQRRHDDEDDGMTPRGLALALHVTEQDVVMGSVTQRRPRVTWRSSADTRADIQQLQQQLRTVVDIIRKLSYDIQARRRYVSHSSGGRCVTDIMEGLTVLYCMSTTFLPRDAMLARYMLSSRVCLSVRFFVRPSASFRHKPVLYRNPLGG